MRVVIGRSQTVWTTTPEGCPAVEAEIHALGWPFVRADGVYHWAEGSMPVVTYRFVHDVHIGPVFDAFDRLRAAGVWIFGHYSDISPFA